MSTLESLLAPLRDGVRRFRARSQDTAEQVRLRLERANLQRDQNDDLRRLGRLVYELHARGTALPSELHEALARLREREDRLERTTDELRARLGRPDALPTPGIPSDDETNRE